jgi:hypothetical protein
VRSFVSLGCFVNYLLELKKIDISANAKVGLDTLTPINSGVNLLGMTVVAKRRDAVLREDSRNAVNRIVCKMRAERASSLFKQPLDLSVLRII